VKRAMAIAGALLLVGAGAWWALREEPPAEGPTVVPMGETVSQVLPGPDGQPEVWTLQKRKGTAESAAAAELPTPAPRTSPADTDTDSARAYNARALEAWKHGDIKAALGYFDAAVAQDPDDWVPHSDYGRLLVMMTSYAEAGPHLERAAELNPDDPRVWLDLLSYYERTLQLERALDSRQRATELAPGRTIEQDRSGLWRLDGESVFP
jgi:tetratricopeptide (TPR) repeat protein